MVCRPARSMGTAIFIRRHLQDSDSAELLTRVFVHERNLVLPGKTQVPKTTHPASTVSNQGPLMTSIKVSSHQCCHCEPLRTEKGQRAQYRVTFSAR